MTSNSVQTIRETAELLNLQELENGRYMFDLLIGTKSMQQMILQGTTETFLAQAKEQSTQFKKQTTKYRLYHLSKVLCMMITQKVWVGLVVMLGYFQR